MPYERPVKWSGWRKGKLGPCPVDPDVWIKAEVDDGRVLLEFPAGRINWNDPEDPIERYKVRSWKHENVIPISNLKRSE
jgi:hypothetical protein